MTTNTIAAQENAAPPAKVRQTSIWRATLAILWKDLQAEARSKEVITAMFIFSLLSVVTFNFALELDRTARANATAGVLWVTLIFAGTLGLGSSLNREKDQGCMDGLLMAPMDRSALYFGKMIGNFIFMSIVAAVMIPLFSVLFSISLFLPLIPAVLALGILGYAGVGTLISSMAVHSRGREVMLPILLLPIALSILIPAVRATRGLLEGREWVEIAVWFQMLIATNVIYIALAYMLFDYVVEE
jgi:heme exporter protein B